MNLSTLIDGIEVEARLGADAIGSIRVCDLTEDSRTALPGSLFVARAGTRDRGAKYITQAIQAGAVAVLTDDPDPQVPDGFHGAVLVSPDASGIGAILAERFYGQPSEQLLIAGVTGTNGKTTIAHLTQQILKHARLKCGLIGTVVIDDGRERGSASMTTPPAIELSRTLGIMVEHQCRRVRDGDLKPRIDQGRTSAVHIDAAGFTNLSGDHLDYHKTIESYIQAKARLFSSLRPGASAVINIDDPVGSVMIDACTDGVKVLRSSMSDPDAEWFGSITDRSVDGMSLTIKSPLGELRSSVPIFGDYNASNILIALGLAAQLLEKHGSDQSEQRRCLESSMRSLRLPRGRLERADKPGDDLRVFVDFAHSDDSIRSCLGALRSVLPSGAKLWCVFGCGGERDRTKRRRVGQAACDGADRVVLTSDNPRSEKPSQIVDDVLAGLSGAQRAKVEVHVDRASAIIHAIENASAGDFVVIAGKGHEPEQIMSDDSGRHIAHQFDDLEHAKDALRDRRASAGVDA